MEYWAKPRMARDQIVLFSPTLDASISDDHPVRLLDEILKGLDWSAWKAEYEGRIIDHTTICKFRTRFRGPLKDLFRQIAETPFAIIKSILGVRRFLLRGLEKVRTEWLWMCTAFNMRKLLAYMAGLRAELAKMLAEKASWARRENLGKGSLGIRPAWPQIQPSGATRTSR